MERLIIKPTESTPYVNFDPELGRLELMGVSFDDEAWEFFIPLYKWVENYRKEAKDKTELKIHFKYFNTSTAKCMYDLLSKFILIHKEDDREVSIKWLYDDDDEMLREEIENFSELTNFPFTIEAVQPGK